jgi:prolyl oligopeptidase
MHARKMAARLQAATSADRPVLLRLEARAEHGAGKPLSKVQQELTDSWTFVFFELGVQL